MQTQLKTEEFYNNDRLRLQHDAHIRAYQAQNMGVKVVFFWCIIAFFYNSFESTDMTVEQINDIAKDKGYVGKGDLLVNLTSMPIVKKGMVNTLRVSAM